MKNRISALIDIAETTLKEIDNNAEDIQAAYIQSDYYKEENDEKKKGKQVNIIDHIKTVLKTVIGNLRSIDEISLGSESGLSMRLADMIEEYVDYIKYVFEDHEDIVSWYDINEYDDVDDYEAISLLRQFANFDMDIVLIGGNGSGKSTLAQMLKGNDFDRITVIPAQKQLFYTEESEILSTRIKDVQSALLNNNIESSKSEYDYSFNEYQKYQFSRLLVAMRENYFANLREIYEHNRTEKSECVYEVIQRIIKCVYTDLELLFGEQYDEYIYCKRGSNKYAINCLSEGEKATIYYSLSVLMASPKSIIVVDEPETFLNPSIANVLWDVLKKERNDCQFIFITHSINFALARNAAKIVWLKEFTYPSSFVFEPIDDDKYTLPKILMTEILGSKKPVLFCEGDDKNSIDYKVYNALFQEKYTVIPVLGHLAVGRNCKVLNDAEWIGIDAKGIVDGDCHEDEKRFELDGVTILPLNEIEMLLLTDEVMEVTIKGSYPNDYKDRISTFKELFWERASNRKEKIVTDKVKAYINNYYENQKMDKCEGYESLEEKYDKLTSIDIKEKINEVERNVNTVLNNRDYNKLLQICNLKKEISRELANKYLDSNYEARAVSHICADKELQDILKEKYFKNLESKV